MVSSEILLWPERNLPLEGRTNPWPRLEIFRPVLVAPPKLPVVVIFPGGGYARNAPHEGAPVATYFASKGFLAAVLNYRVAPDLFPAPYIDAARGVRIMRKVCTQMGGDPERITVVGFSAGGHLAALLGTRPDLVKDESDDLGSLPARPDRMVLAYPVVSFVDDPHEQCIRHLLGEGSTHKERARKSIELLVSSETPPTFLFHAASDSAVSCRHTMLFSRAMRKARVQVRTHLAAEGEYGSSIFDSTGDVHEWVGQAIEWILRA